MTDTIENTETAVTGTIEHVDPNTLVLEVNVRPDQMLNKQFIASIKEHGVIEPILARRGDDGTIYVRAGARRTMAAVEAGLATVPVYVTDADDDTATRVIQQITENDHRLALRQIDRVNGIQQLLDTGLSVTKVAKKLAVSAERVKQSKTVAASQVALEAVAANEVTLAEAAVIAEFEGDDDAVERLRNAAGGSWFDHTAQTLRQAREDRKAYASAKLRYETQGFQVLGQTPRPWDPEYVPLGYIENDVDPNASPQHWAIIIDENEVFTDSQTGEVIDESTIDWNTESNPNAEPRDGMRSVEGVVETTGFVVGEYYCRDIEALGLTVSDRFKQFSGQADLGASTGGRGADTPVDDLAEKRERRKVIALNKAAEAAQAVRRDFITKLLVRKTPPKGAMVFVARLLAVDPYLLSNYKALEVTTELLGVRSGAMGSDVAEMVGKADNDARAQVILMGMVLGALEGRTPKSAWRQSGYHSGSPKEYLMFLAEQGYALSAVEHVMTGDREADDVYEELTREQ